MKDLKREGETTVAKVGAPSARLRKTKIVIKTPAAGGPAKVVVSLAPARPRKRGWLGWLRSLLEGIVNFVKSLAPLVAALV